MVIKDFNKEIENATQEDRDNGENSRTLKYIEDFGHRDALNPMEFDRLKDNLEKINEEISPENMEKIFNELDQIRSRLKHRDHTFDSYHIQPYTQVVKVVVDKASQETLNSIQNDIEKDPNTLEYHNGVIEKVVKEKLNQQENQKEEQGKDEYQEEEEERVIRR